LRGNSSYAAIVICGAKTQNSILSQLVLHPPLLDVAALDEVRSSAGLSQRRYD